MGLSSSKTKTSSSSKSTTTPNVPSWIEGPTQTLVGQINTLAGQAPQSTPASVLQERAFGNAAQLGGDPTTEAQGATRDLLGYTPSAVTPGSLADTDLSKYTNPWDSSVLDATLGDIERFRGMGINNNSANATLSGGVGAWGGSRTGVSDSLTNEAALKQAASTAASLRQAGFLNAQQGAQFDIGNRFTADQFNTNAGLTGANLRLNAAGQLGSQAAAGAESRRADVGLMGNLGAQQHEIDQANNPQNVQMKYIQNLLRLLQESNPSLFTGQTTNAAGTNTTTNTPSLLDSLGSIVQTAGTIASI